MTLTEVDPRESRAAEPAAPAPPVDPPAVRATRAVPKPLRSLLTEVGSMGQLIAKVVMSAVKRPTGFWGEAVDQTYSMLRYSLLSSMMAIGGFVSVMSVYAYDLVSLVGAQSRLSTYLVMAIAREISPFGAALAVAGVLGTALTADLGARKVREELDALKVLGVDVIRTLILPRVVAIWVLTIALTIVGLVIGLGCGIVAGTVLGNTSVGTFMSNFFAIMTTAELVGVLVKSTIVGVYIAIVCAAKGMAVKGGPEGVGRAVNQAVVIALIGSFILNFMVNNVVLGFSPEMQVNR